MTMDDAFEVFEHQVFDIVGELQTIASTEKHLREALKAECSRAENAESARDSALRGTDEARADAATAAAGATQIAGALAVANEDLATTKMQLEVADRHRSLLEARCSELINQLSSAERELEQLRPVKTSHGALQRQYMELQNRVREVSEQTKKTVTQLETELRTVERCASGGAELRERARLAAAGHVRERRLAAAEMRHTTLELKLARVEILRMKNSLAEINTRNAGVENKNTKDEDTDRKALSEAQEALQSERANVVRLERVLASALADNAALAAMVASVNNSTTVDIKQQSPVPETSLDISALDSFLAE